jgi:AAA+ ATPase superfamily predicted ATPase
MPNTKESNPFPVNKYMGKDYFCDRQKETKTLLNNIVNGNSSTIIALRRIGKTGLIHHVLHHLPKGFQGVYVDLLETENMQQFLNMLASAILTQIPEKTRFGKAILKFLSGLRPTISFDPLNGLPQASFTVSNEEAKTNINAVFDFLEKHSQRIVVAIDEFQQILNYPEKNVDAWLRSRIQQMHNIVFIFSGSQQHLMAELFGSPKRPFYRSSQIVQLKKIEEHTYSDFIIRMFSKSDTKISKATAKQVLHWTDRHTYYIQVLCNRLYSLHKEQITEEDWKSEAFELLKEQELLFFSFRNILAKNQWKVLKAIAKNGRTYKPTAQKFLQEHHLGSSATVLKAIKALMNAELIYKDYEENGDSYYAVYDLFFRRWSENTV